MLKRLRLQLTLLYLLAALSLVVLIGVGSYSLVKFYFDRETDQALQYKMAEQFRSYNLPLPAELLRAEQIWLEINGRPAVVPTATQTKPLMVQESEDDGYDVEGEDGSESTTPSSPQPQREESDEDSYDGQLASIFSLPLDANGNLISGANPLFGLNALGGALSVRMKNGFDNPGQGMEMLQAQLHRAPVPCGIGLVHLSQVIDLLFPGLGQVLD